MQSRSGSTTLLVGLVIAVFSGAGVALSILSDNSSSLVGVAISAALLPPAVNSGLCWAVAAAQETVQCASGPDARASSLHVLCGIECGRMNATSAMSLPPQSSENRQPVLIDSRGCNLNGHWVSLMRWTCSEPRPTC